MGSMLRRHGHSHSLMSTVFSTRKGEQEPILVNGFVLWQNKIDGWNEGITRILGIFWRFLIGAELTIIKSRISLVNKIQKATYTC